MPPQAIGDVAGKSHVGNARQVARQERIVAHPASRSHQSRRPSLPVALELRPDQQTEAIPGDWTG